RPRLPRVGAGRHVPEARRDGRSQRGEHDARHDVVQPLPADDGRRRAVPGRGRRPAPRAGASGRRPVTWRAGDAKGRPATRGPALGELGRDPAGEGAGFTPETAPSSALPDGFAYLDEVVPGARWEVRYATRDNFTG